MLLDTVISAAEYNEVCGIHMAAVRDVRARDTSEHVPLYAPHY